VYGISVFEFNDVGYSWWWKRAFTPWTPVGQYLAWNVR